MQGPLSHLLRPQACFKGSSGTNTSTTSSGPPPQVLANYEQVYNQAQGVTQQPYQAYGGSMIAGFNPQQTAAFNNINTASNAAQPFINTGSQYTANATGDAQPYFNGAAQSVNQAVNMLQPGQFGSTVAQYESPYTQQVVNATQAEFNNENQQQQQQVQGNAIASGAFGGDRQAVAAAQTAGQEQLAQAPVIAGLENTGYQNATNEANTAAQSWLTGANTYAGLGNTVGNLDLSSGYAMGNLGNEAQSTGLAGASAQLQAGGLQQQLAQEELNVPYQQYLAGQAYPYQTTNYLANIAEGTGSLSGGTGTTSTPGPSTLSQAAGLGLSGAAMYALLNRGGAVEHRDAGGAVSGMGQLPSILSLDSLPTIPQAQSSGAHSTIPSPPKPTQQQESPLSSVGGIGGLSSILKLANGNPSNNNSDLLAPGDTTFGGSGGSGGLADTGFITPPIPPVMDSRGGAIMPHHHTVQQIIQSLSGLGAIRAPKAAPQQHGSIAGLGRDLGGSVGSDAADLYAGLPTSTLQQMMAVNPPTTPQGSLMQQIMSSRQGNAADAGLSAPQGFDDGGAVVASGPDLPDWALRDPVPTVTIPHTDTSASSDAPLPAATTDTELPVPPTPPADAPNGASADAVLTRLRQSSADTDAQTQAAAPSSTGRAGDLLQPSAQQAGLAPLPDVQVAPNAAPPQQSGLSAPSTISAPTSSSSSHTDNPMTSPWGAVLAAGLGMMSGTSKFPLVNIGTGGMAGVQALGQMSDQRTKQIQAEQAQDNLDLTRSYRAGMGGGTPGGGQVAGMAAPASAGNGMAVDGSGRPLFNIGQQYARAQQMMMIPQFADAGKAQMSFLEALVKDGVVPDGNGGVVALPGYAGAKANVAGATAAATAPFDVAKALASQAGRPIELSPGNTAVSGGQLLSPDQQALIRRVTGAQSANTAQSASQSSQTGPYSDYSMKIARHETGINNPTATNGDHVGPGQFDPQTWLTTFKQAYPQQTAGQSDQQLLAQRTNPNVAMPMIDQLARVNAPKLAAAGIPVNQSSAFMAHWFGPAGAIRLANAPANTPMERLFDADLLRQNGLAGKTAGQVIGSVVQQFGTGPIPGAQQQPVQYASNTLTNTATDATPAPAPSSSFQPAGAAIPSMINVTRPPPDLPASPVTSSPSMIRNPDGSMTSSLNPYSKAIETKYGDTVGAIPDQIKKLNDAQLTIVGLHDEVAKNAAQPGWYQSGAGAEWRQDIAKAANGTSAALGGKPVFDPASVANTEEFNKNSSVAAFTLARTMAGGRVALGEVTQANRSVPNMGNTPFGNVMVTHLLLQDNVHQQDRLSYQADQAAHGVDPVAAGKAFDQINPPSRYVAAAGASAVREAYPQVVTALKSAPTPANIQAFNRKFGEGVGELLLSARQ